MVVTIDYLFSKNYKIGSKLISWGTKHLTNIEDVPSHVAILVNNRWVHESTLDSGVRVISYSEWLNINIEVKKITGKPTEYRVIKNIFKDIKNKKYDWLGVTYLGLCLIPNKAFNVKLPAVNKWQDNDKYFCTEAVEKLIGLSDCSMKSPVQLLNELLNGNIS